MGRRLAHGAALSLGFALGAAACADDDDVSPPSTFTPGETINETKPPPTVDEPPSGACHDEGAEQLVRTPGGLEACRSFEAGAHVADVPNTWRCTCTSARWRCEIVHGGFGVMTCP
jgi:hypothetical protein